MQQKKGYIARCVIATLITVVGLNLAGSVTSILTHTQENDFWIAGWLISLAALLLLALISFVGGKLYVARKNKMNYVETKDYMLSRKGSADADPALIARCLQKVGIFANSYIALCLLLLVFNTFCLGAMKFSGFLMLDFLVFISIYSRLFDLSQKPDFSEYAGADEYPELYRLARSAADTVGVKGQLHICILHDCNAGIRRLGKDISL